MCMVQSVEGGYMYSNAGLTYTVELAVASCRMPQGTPMPPGIQPGACSKPSVNEIWDGDNAQNSPGHGLLKNFCDLE